MGSGALEAMYLEALGQARSGDIIGAMGGLSELLARHPRHLGARNALAVLRLETGDPAGALALLRPLVKELPDAAPILLNYGNALLATQRSADAIGPLRKATKLDPRNPLVWYGYGRALQIAGQPAEALPAYARVLELNPAHVEARANRAAALMFLDRYEEAESEAAAAIKQEPGHAGAHFNRSMALLAMGRWAEGWAEYEWRERTTLLDGMKRTWTQPRWEGEPLEGRTLLVHAEQGFGDTLQFVRWVPLLRQLGATVRLVVPPALTTLLAAADLADSVSSFGDSLPPHDSQVPLTGLPHRLRLHTAEQIAGAAQPYLRMPSATAPGIAEWVAALPPRRLRVGLVWAGSATHVNDRHRSIPLRVLEPLLAHPDVTWVSLQAGDRAAELQRLPTRVRVHDAAPLLLSFAHTAQLLCHLDLVVSVDSAVAHLAGALGCPCHLLLPRIGLDWRWVEAPSRHWYDTLATIRQQTPGIWKGEIRVLHDRLGARADAP